MTSPSRNLTHLIGKCSKPIFHSRDDVREAARGLIDLSPFFHFHELKKLVSPLQRVCKKAPDLLDGAVNTASPHFTAAESGRKVAVLLKAAASSHNSADFWSSMSTAVANGLSGQQWGIDDCHWIVSSISKRGFESGLEEPLTAYLKARIESGSPSDISWIFITFSTVPFLRKSPLLLQACNKFSSMEGVDVPCFGQVCYCLNRIQYTHHNLAISVQEEADRIAEVCDLFTAVNVFYFICRHDKQYINSESLQWLAESLMTGEMDCETVMTVCTALAALPKKVRQSMKQEISDICVYLSGQVQELLELSVNEGGIKDESSMDRIQSFVSKFLHLSHILLQNEVEPSNLPDELQSASVKCASLVDRNAEQIVSDENPPFSLIPHLLDSPFSFVKECGVHVLSELSKQAVHIPSLQTFRFLLLLGNNRVQEKAVLKYLRSQFARTSADIPIVQLCSALKCFIPVLAIPVRKTDEKLEVEVAVQLELEDEETETFFRYIKEVVLKNVAVGVDLRCVMAILDTLLQLGCTDAQFFDLMLSYMDSKCANGISSPSEQSCEAATSILQRMDPKVLESHNAAKTFLDSVAIEGEKGESLLTPSQWMELHDPSHALLPLTEEQQQGWAIIETMVVTKADDKDELIRLAQQYVALLPQLRPDDNKYFFGVFAEKVLKEDGLLKDCLRQIISTGIVTKLSASTIASILGSLSAVRFSYARTIKDFLLGISAEQWSTMEAIPLVQILQGMSKLSMRLPPVLDRIVSRIHEIYRFMGPYEVSQSIHSLQSLGIKNDAVLMELMEHAASSARSFDEGSLALLFSAPSVHRLFRTPQLALPLIQRSARSPLSPRAKEKVLWCLTKSPLPRELIKTATSDLLADESPKDPLRLTTSG